MASKALTIGLLWHSPNSNNLGVGALTLSHINLIRQATADLPVSVSFIVYGFIDKRPYYLECGDDIQITALNSRLVFLPWSGLGKKFSKCDLILDIGGGDSFTDIYGWKRFLFLTVSKIKAFNRKVPLVFAPQTIGPFEHWLTRKIARKICLKTTHIFTRDYQSQQFALNDLGLTPSLVSLTTDVAFALPCKKNALRSHVRPRIGINISGLLYDGGYSGKNDFHITLDYEQLIADCIDYFTNLNCDIHLISHVLTGKNGKEDDLRAAQNIALTHPGTHLELGFQSPVEAKSLIATMDFFIGSRMHACIAALSCGIPTVPLAYSRKFHGLFSSLDYQHTIDCRQETTASAFSKIKTLYENRERLAHEAKISKERAHQRLKTYSNFLTTFITQRYLND